jgi:hypothetical protein
MTPFEVFSSYLALKQHFTTKSYDVFKYNWKTRAKFDTFNKRKDKIFFEKIAKHDNPKNFLLSNFIINDKPWVKDIAYSETSKKIYENWNKTQQSLTYIFLTDLSQFDENFNSNFQVVENQHPKLLILYMSHKISFETLTIMCELVGCLNVWDKKMKGDPVWESISLKIRKYAPFLNYDKNKYKNMILEKF